MRWQPLDLFDEIEIDVEPEPWVRELIDAWPRPGEKRPGNVLPEIYDLAPLRGAGSAAHERARPFAAGTAIALLALLALRPRRARTLCLVVALIGGAIGGWSAAAAVEPYSVCEVRIHEPGRTTVYSMFRAEIDGAEMAAPPGAPFFYRGPGEPWWEGPDRVLRADRGVIRGFRRVEAASEPLSSGTTEERRELRPVVRRHISGGQPRAFWGPGVFRAGSEPAVPLLELVVGPVR